MKHSHGKHKITDISIEQDGRIRTVVICFCALPNPWRKLKGEENEFHSSCLHSSIAESRPGEHYSKRTGSSEQHAAPGDEEQDSRMIILLPLLVIAWALSPHASPECVFLRDDRTIKCQNSTLLEVSESLHVLTAVVRNRPKALEAESCGEKPNYLSRLPFEDSAVEMVRIHKCNLQDLEEGAFENIALTLRDLDLSHNQLEQVPEALRRLDALERLNLRHNRITWVRPDGPLSNLARLSELELGHNHLGFTEDDEGYYLKDPLSQEEFSVGRHLHSLGLQGNRLSTLPAQVITLTELRSLDVSENDLVQLGSGLSTLRHLRTLDLHSNRLRGVSFDALPDSIRRLDLTENPLYCNCSLMWLHEWTNGNEIQLASCYGPPHLKGRALNQVNWDSECPDHNATFRYMARGLNDITTKNNNGSGNTYDVVRLSSTPTSITVSWRVREPRSEGWTVVYRREKDSPYQMTLAPPDERRHTSSDLLTQTLKDLQPHTQYVVCIARVLHARYTIETGKCVRIETSGRPTAWTELEEVKASASAVSISWLLRAAVLTDDVSYRHEWTVQLRRMGSEHFTDVPVYDITTGAETDGQHYEYALGELAPRTFYEVCLVDVEHRPLEGMPITNFKNTSACVTVQTSGHHVLQGAEIAAVTFACILCIIVCVVTIVLCHQKRLLWCQSPFSSSPKIPPAEPETPPIRKERHNFAGSWNALSLSYTDLDAVPRPQYRSFRTLGYRDALTSVTIYSSGYSEC
ncbi:chondroadherin-like protein [Nephila pilipes]|uniref:Chondroadherin-like protein n=1 Tax=Nephila pilipes TaxID=299642 RepID=A0A8X6MEL9_NEPPI|nr:chondroadherin-like protein [Nephila pilipes]